VQDVEFEDDDEGGEGCGGCLVDCRSTMSAFCIRHEFYITAGLLVLLVLLYFAYFIYALYYEFGDEGSIRLLWITCLVVLILAVKLLFHCLRPYRESILSSKQISWIRKHHNLINWFVDLLIHVNKLLNILGCTGSRISGPAGSGFIPDPEKLDPDR